MTKFTDGPLFDLPHPFATYSQLSSQIGMRLFAAKKGVVTQKNLTFPWFELVNEVRQNLAPTIGDDLGVGARSRLVNEKDPDTL